MKDRTKEIRIFSILIIIYALWDWRVYTNFKHYCFLFSSLPERLIIIRYIFSISFRIALIVTSVGIFLFRDTFRKAIVFFGFFIIATIYWKHPIDCFRNIITMLVQQGAVPNGVMPLIGIMPWILLLLSYIFDIGFALCMIVFFMLPEITRRFTVKTNLKCDKSFPKRDR